MSSPVAGGNTASKYVFKHFDVVLKAITGCVVEFVLFTIAWISVYVTTGILEVEECPVDVIMIILVHTTVTSILYSASYTTYNKKVAKGNTKRAQNRRYRYVQR